jgi:hypothetical protein
VTHTDIVIECANCGRSVRDSDAKDAGWRYWSDGIDLHLIWRPLRLPRVPARRAGLDW